MRIGIFGLGYVGTVSAVCLAASGHRVIGVDTNPHKVESINAGRSPIVEPGVAAMLRAALDTGMLCATTEVEDVVLGSDLSMICVGTPSRSNGSLSLDQVTRVAEQIGFALRRSTRYHAVALRSTALPGTVDRVTRAIEEASGKRAGEDFGVACNPEFLREGSSVRDYQNPPYTIVGTEHRRAADVLRELYADVAAPFHVVDVREAELLKYACNSFHALKVAFANEIGAISKELGIDSHVVMRIFAEDTKLNISPYYLTPAFAFGGSCLPKDVRAITYESRALDVSTPLLNSLLPSNEVHIRRVVDWVIATHRRSVGVLGLSFKSDTDDLRESPIVSVVETLIGKGFSVSIYDANVNTAKLVGANKSYIEQEIPHITSLMTQSPREVLDRSEVILVANRGEGFERVLRETTVDQIVLDLVRVSAADDTMETMAGRYEGIGW